MGEAGGRAAVERYALPVALWVVGLGLIGVASQLRPIEAAPVAAAGIALTLIGVARVLGRRA